ncbi:5304_t:CDS:2 [Entrophospora sp. SA101]|nr:5304_t:CDS:2 [Entrophospora sp. SA101]
MVYPDGINKGEIISSYLQKKALNLVLSNRGKQDSSATGIQNKIKLLKSENEKLTKKIESATSKKRTLAIKLKKQEQNRDLYISRMRSLVSKRKNVSEGKIQKNITKKIKENKHTYTPEFTALISQISNIEVAELAIIENLPNSTSTFASYGILADESTRGDKKIFLVCVAHWNTIKEEPIITILSMKDLDCCTSTNLECSRNVPEGYLHKWKTFLEFLLNEKLNIEILIMVKFGEWFYERIINFLIGSDKHPYIIQGTSSKPLPNGYRAHQMPEMVEIWIDELKNALQSPDEIFIKELQTARDLLNEQEFLNLADKVQLGSFDLLQYSN